MEQCDFALRDWETGGLNHGGYLHRDVGEVTQRACRVGYASFWFTFLIPLDGVGVWSVLNILSECYSAYTRTFSETFAGVKCPQSAEFQFSHLGKSGDAHTPSLCA